MIDNQITFADMLLIDDLISEIKEEFYAHRLTHLRRHVYNILKNFNDTGRSYFIQELTKDKFLIKYFADIIFQIEFEISEDFDAKLFKKGETSRQNLKTIPDVKKELSSINIYLDMFGKKKGHNHE